MFDSHCHLDFEELAPMLDEHLALARKSGVRGWFVPGCSPSQWPRLGAIKREDVFLGIGLHPYFTTDAHDADQLCAEIKEACHKFGAVALGECGLDRGRGAEPEVQQRLFEAQLRLARELDLPVVMHQVGLRDEFLSSLERVGVPRAGGVVHGFGGDVSWGRALVQRGLRLGLGPAITRVRREKLRQAAAELPLESLLIETDAPDQRPSERTAPGTPIDLLAVCQTLAELRQITPREVALSSEKAAREFYRLA